MNREFLELIKTRRSCRKYKPEQITDEELQAVIRICKAAEVCGMDAQSVYEYLEKKCQL